MNINNALPYQSCTYKALRVHYIDLGDLFHGVSEVLIRLDFSH